MAPRFNGVPGRRVTRCVEIVISNRLPEIAAVRDALDRLGEESGLPARDLVPLQVALDEIVSNIVKYAWEDAESHQILVRISVSPTDVVVDIFDDGRPFDPALAPAREAAREAARPAPGGVGIDLVRKLVDRFSYERVGGRNHTCLARDRAPTPHRRRD